MEMAKEFNIPKVKAGKMLNFVENQVIETVRSGDAVVLNIGKFQMKKTKARNGRNPSTGKTIKIPAKTKPVFKASKKFKEGIV
jgi:DNA-binding protein HU-beta